MDNLCRHIGQLNQLKKLVTNQTDEVSKAPAYALCHACAQVGEESSFIDLWLDADQGRQVEGEGVRQGSLVQVENLVPVNVGEDDDVVVRFVSGGIVRRLQGEEARGLATTIDERRSGSQLNMTSVQAVINMVDMDGTFEYESQQVSSAASEVANSVQENPPSRKLATLLPPVPQVEKDAVLRGEERTVDMSLSPWDPSQTNQKNISQQGRTDEMISTLSSWNSAEQSSTNKTSADLDPSKADVGIGEEGVRNSHVADQQSNEEDVVPSSQESKQGDIVEGLSRLRAEEKELGDEGNSQGSASLLDSQESPVSAF